MEKNNLLFNLYQFLISVVVYGSVGVACILSIWNTNGGVSVADSIWNLWSVARTKQDSFKNLYCQLSNVKHLLLSRFYSLVQVFSWCNVSIAPLKSMELCQVMLLRISPFKCCPVLWIVLIDFSNFACWILV